MNLKLTGFTTQSLALVLVIGATVITYLPGLNGPFLFDDNIHITQNPQVQISELSLGSLTQAWNSSFASGISSRPLAQLSFGINHAMGGLSPYGYKATNLAIHLLNGLLVYLLAGYLARTTPKLNKSPEASSRRHWFVLAVTALWLLHPINLTSVLYVVQRMALLSTFFLLAGLCFYVSGRLALSAGRGGLWRIITAFPVAAVGFLAKENVALFPVFLLVLEFTLLRRLDQPNSRPFLLLVWALGIGLPLVLGAVYLLTHDTLLNFSGRPFSLDERLLTQARALWFYLVMIIAPSVQSLGFSHDDFILSTNLLNPATTLAAVLSWIVLIGATLALSRKWPIFAFAVLFFLAGHLLESTVLPLELVFEHRNYLASLGPIFGIAWLLMVVPNSLIGQRYLPLLIPLLCLLFAATTHLRATDWQSTTSLVLSEVDHHPDSPRNNFKAAQIYIGLLDRVEDKQVVYEAARGHLEQILRLDPRHPDAFFALIILNLHAELPPEASWVDLLEKELREGKIDPTRFTVSQFSFLVLWQMNSDYRLEHQIVLRLMEAALNNQTVTATAVAGIYSARRAYYQNVLEQPDLAIKDARRAALYWPTRWHYQKRLAELALQLNQLEEAEKVLKRTLRQDLPDNYRKEAQKLLEMAEKARSARP